MMKLLVAPLILAITSCYSGPGPITPTTKVERQMVGLLEKFDRWDDNGDGELTVKEVNQGINRFKGTPMQVSYTGKQVIEFYDTDQSGTVTLREAQEGFQRADEVNGKLSR